MTPSETTDDPQTPETTTQPSTGFTSFWGSTADLRKSSSTSSLLLYGQQRKKTSSSFSNNKTTRPGTAPSKRRRRSKGTPGLQHSFSDRILRPKSRGSSRPSTAKIRPPRGSSASLKLMNTIRLKKGKTTLSYTQKYKYGVKRSVYHPVAQQTIDTNNLKQVLSLVLASMSTKYGNSPAKVTALAALRSVLDYEPTIKDIQDLAIEIKQIDNFIRPKPKGRNPKTRRPLGAPPPWEDQPIVIRETKRTLELSSSYQPQPLMVKKWRRGQPVLKASTQKGYRQATKDHVRDKVQGINTLIDEAMHIRSGMHAERERRKQLIEVFLQAMAVGGIDVRKVAQTFILLDVDRSGSVDRSEFANALLELNLGISPQNCGSLFDAIDIDQSGDLEISEFMEAITGTMREEVRESMNAVVHSDEVDSLAVDEVMKHNKEVKKASATVVKRVKSLLAQRSFSGGIEAALMELFMKSDVDGSGSISRDEFAMAMEKLGVDLEKHDIDAVVNKADKDGGGELEYWEFVKMLRPPKRKKFVKQDTVADGAGGVPIFGVSHETDMQLVYGRRSIGIETERLKMKALAEQIEMFRPIDAHNALHALYVALAAKHMTASQLYAFFMDLDKDGSGTIEAPEFRHTMQKVLNLGLTNPQLDILAKTLDSDGNGDVSYLELKKVLHFDTNQEGRQNRKNIEQATYERSLKPKELIASKAGNRTPFTKVTPFTPFGGNTLSNQQTIGWPMKKAAVPSDGGRYATPFEAHRNWYCSGTRLQPLPHSEANPSQILKSYPQPKIRSLTRHLRKPATPTPYYLRKTPASFAPSNYFSGMLGQRSLVEKEAKAMARSTGGSRLLPNGGGKTDFSTISTGHQSGHHKPLSSSSSSGGIDRRVTTGAGSIASPMGSNIMSSSPMGSNTVPLARVPPRPKSQQRSNRSKSQTIDGTGENRDQVLKRASTAPIGIARPKSLSRASQSRYD